MLVVVFGVLPWYIPVLVFALPAVALGISLPILAVLIFIVYWIPKYYDTMVYKLTEKRDCMEKGSMVQENGNHPL